eukprot:143796_1
MIASRIQSTIILSVILLIEYHYHAEAFSVISMSLQQKPPFRPSNRRSNPYGDAPASTSNGVGGISTTTSTSTHSIIDGSHVHNIHSTASYLDSMSAPATPTATDTSTVTSTYSPPSTDIDIDIDIDTNIDIEEISKNNAASLYFQLEEREDKDTCTTELFLKKDGTVLVFDSDGPLPISATGTWGQSTDKKFFIMNIKRTFGTGSDGRDMGEFCFEVERSYEGTMTTVGEKTLAMEGAMHLVDEFRGDLKVGFFSMIDTTAAKLGEEEDNDDDKGGENKEDWKGGKNAWLTA